MVMDGVRTVRSVSFKRGVFWVKCEDGRKYGYDPGQPIGIKPDYESADFQAVATNGIPRHGPYVHKETGIETFFAYTSRGRYSMAVQPYDTTTPGGLRRPPSYSERWDWELWEYRGEPGKEHPGSLQKRQERAHQSYISRLKTEWLAILHQDDRPESTHKVKDKYKHFTAEERARMAVRTWFSSDFPVKCLPDFLNDPTVATVLEDVARGNREMSDEELRAYIREAQGL